MSWKNLPKPSLMPPVLFSAYHCNKATARRKRKENQNMYILPYRLEKPPSNIILAVTPRLQRMSIVWSCSVMAAIPRRALTAFTRAMFLRFPGSRSRSTMISIILFSQKTLRAINCSPGNNLLRVVMQGTSFTHKLPSRRKN